MLRLTKSKALGQSAQIRPDPNRPAQILERIHDFAPPQRSSTTSRMERNLNQRESSIRSGFVQDSFCSPSLVLLRPPFWSLRGACQGGRLDAIRAPSRPIRKQQATAARGLCYLSVPQVCGRLKLPPQHLSGPRRLPAARSTQQRISATFAVARIAQRSCSQCFIPDNRGRFRPGALPPPPGPRCHRRRGPVR